MIASASEDGSVRLWEMFNGKQVKSWTAHGGGTLSVQFNHSGDLVTAGRDRQVKIWDQNGKQKRAINGFKSLPLEAVISNEAHPPVVLCGARVHNLRGVDLKLEFGELTGVCGPSGSGKSTLVLDALVEMM